MQYFKVDSEDTAKELSRLIYSVMNPSAGDTQFLFGWKSNKKATVICIPEIECPVFLKSDFSEIMDKLELMLNGKLQEGEGTGFVDYLKTGKINLQNIIPSGFEQVDESFLKENGFYHTL